MMDYELIEAISKLSKHCEYTVCSTCIFNRSEDYIPDCILVNEYPCDWINETYEEKEEEE